MDTNPLLAHCVNPSPPEGAFSLTRGRDWPENPSTLFFKRKKKKTFTWKPKRASDQLGISHTDERARVCAVLSFVFVRSMSQTAEVAERVKVTFLIFLFFVFLL